MFQSFYRLQSATYVNLQAWLNVENLSALGGKLPFYFLMIFILLIIAFYPARIDLLKGKVITKIIVFYIADLIAILVYIVGGAPVSATPLSSTIQLFQTDIPNFYKDARLQQKDQAKKINQIENEFKKPDVQSGISLPLKKPNVIVIFTEGMSASTLDYVNQKNLNLTPNLDQFAKETINFKNYFNHTAATYHGIRGQLFSSEQFLHGYEYGIKNVSKLFDTKMVSLQSILKDHGYSTTMFNPEPESLPFQTYLENLGFDKVITSNNLSKKVGKNPGVNSIVTDGNNYQSILTNMKKEKSPFLYVTYTYQTHLSADYDYSKKGINDDRLNQFYSLDKNFGKFWNQFKKTKEYQNTIVVFTTDHATYPDPDFRDSFDEKQETFVAPIPLMIYYPNQQSKTINVNGKNSLSLAPTLLDLLNIENQQNYFLGKSLFVDSSEPLQYTSNVAGEFFSTKDSNVVYEKQQNLIEQIYRYYLLSVNYQKINLGVNK
jgi:phosphoglycerol transferase MdoB-like AlkP superfamily enzyme